MRKPRVWIGTSGWNYKHWKKSFYPEGLPSREWLHYYSSRFDTVELNTSFYRIPSKDSVREWQKTTPVCVRFALKLWRGITHYKKLKDCREHLRNFLDAAEVFDARRRGPLLIQLPPNQGKDLDRLRFFLDDLKEVSEARWKIVVEFRNDQWLCDQVYNLLDKQRAAVCLHDMPGSVTIEPNDASFVYIRRHGSEKSRYRGRYTEAQIKSDAQRVRRWLRQGRTVYAYFNNDVKGYAVENAFQLEAALK